MLNINPFEFSTFIQWWPIPLSTFIWERLFDKNCFLSDPTSSKIHELTIVASAIWYQDWYPPKKKKKKKRSRLPLWENNSMVGKKTIKNHVLPHYKILRNPKLPRSLKHNHPPLFVSWSATSRATPRYRFESSGPTFPFCYVCPANSRTRVFFNHHDSRY